MLTRSVCTVMVSAAWAAFLAISSSSLAVYWFSACHSAYSRSTILCAVLLASSRVLYASSICSARVFLLPALPEDLPFPLPPPVGFVVGSGTASAMSASRSFQLSPLVPSYFFVSLLYQEVNHCMSDRKIQLSVIQPGIKPFFSISSRSAMNVAMIRCTTYSRNKAFHSTYIEANTIQDILEFFRQPR